MLKKSNRLSFFLSLLLVLQLFLPVINAFAAEVATPTNLKVSISNFNDIVLSWDKVFGVDSYNIYKVNDNGNEFFAKSFGNSWSKKGLAEGAYTIVVTAVKGTSESEVSTPVTFEIKLPEMQAPLGLVATINNVNDLTLQWQTAQNANSYNVYKVVNGERAFIVNTTGTNRTFSNLAEGNYVYEITSVNTRFGESKTGNQISISIVYPVIQPPNGLNYTIRNENDLTIKWQAAEHANSYNIYKNINGERTFVINTIGLNYYFPRLTEGNYIYEVTTVSNSFGESKTSSQINVPIIYPLIQSPEGFTATISNGNDLKLQWLGAENADSYNLYEVVDDKRNLIINTTNLSRSFSKLTEGDYVYEVTTVSSRFGESKTGSQISVSIIFPVIQAPESLTATINNVNNLSLLWPRAEYANRYNIYEIINGERKIVASTEDTFDSFPNLAEGKYTYEVTSVNDRFGESRNGQQVEVLIVFPEMVEPVIALEMKERNSAVMSWEKVDYAEYYNVYELVDGVPVYKTKALSNGYYLSNLTDGLHQYLITSFNSKFGESGYSNIVDANVLPEVPIDETPELPAPPASEPVVQGDDVTLNWDAVDAAKSYNIYKQVDGEKILVGSTSDTTFTIKDLEAGDHEFIIVPVSESDVEGSNYTTVTVQAEDFDVTPPVTTSNAMEDWLKGEFTVELTANDDKSGVAKTFYSVNGSEFVEGTSFVASEPGFNEVRFYSIDNAGNVEVVNTVEVKIDNKPPVTTSNASDKWLKEAFKVELTATDDLSGVAKTLYSINGSEFTEGTSFVVSESGVNKVTFYSIDNAGNIEEVKTIEIKIDEKPPVTTSNVPDKWVKTFTVELTASDDLSGVAQTFYSVNGSEYTEGTSVVVTESGVNEVTFYSIDNAGNIEEVKTVQVKVDNTPPVTTTNDDENWLKEAFKVEFTATDDFSGIAKTLYSVNGSEFTEGTYVTITESGVNTVAFYSIDHAGNKEEVKTVQVKIDKAPPITSSNATEHWLNLAFTLELSASDDLSGVAKTFFSVNGSEFTEGASVVVTEDGINEVTFYSIDNAGNKEEVKTVFVKIDKAPPVTTSNVTDNWLKEAFTVELLAKDDFSGVAKTFYSLNGSKFSEGTSVVVTEEGMNKVSFYSVDNTGNIEKVSTVEVKIDKSAPVVSWNLADEYALGTSLGLNYTATDKASGIAKETITVNGQVYKKGDSVNLNQPGTYKVVVTVTDLAGWTTTLEKTLVVYIKATIEVTPGVIKVNNGVFTVRVTVPQGIDPAQFDLSSATLNGVSAISGTNGLVQQAKKGQFKFNREDFNWKPGTVEVEFRALVNGYLVVGKTTVEVK